MAKEKQAVSDKKLAITKQIDKINLHKGSFREVNMADIVPSDFEPQVRRRAHFTDEEIEELKTSIEQNGLIEDIVVRPQGDKYQIVCGERRWLAIKKIGWKQIEVKVRELSDSAAIRVQMEENLQRKQLDPLEEAFSYKYLMDKANYSVRDLHIKFGRSERNIVQKLKLNDLSEEGKTLLAELKLPLGHAVEIAKYSPKQQADLLKKGAFKEIYLKNAESGKYEHINVPKSFTELKDHIRREVFRNLDIAPFSKSSTELHKEGLSCKNCPDHTGAKINQSLFDEGEIGKNDNCLNAKCFEGKMEAHIELKRKEIAEAANIAVETVPYITTEWKTKHKGLEPVRSYHYQEVDKKESCPSTVKGVFIDGKQIGLAILICQNKDCEIHGKGTTYSPKEQTPEEIEKARIYELERSQNNFETNLRTTTRKAVFEKYLENPEVVASLMTDDEFIVRIVSEVKDNKYGTKEIEELLGIDIEKFDSEDDLLNPTGYEPYFRTIDNQTCIKLLFLLVMNYDERIMYSENITYTKTFAEKMGLNYPLIEAEKLVELAPEEHQAEAEIYLKGVRDGVDGIKKPCFFVEKDYPDAPADDDDSDEDLELDNEELHDDEDDVDENDLGETSQG